MGYIANVCVYKTKMLFCLIHTLIYTHFDLDECYYTAFLCTIGIFWLSKRKNSISSFVPNISSVLCVCLP